MRRSRSRSSVVPAQLCARWWCRWRGRRRQGAGEVRAAVTDQEPEAREPVAEVEGQVTGLLYRPLARRVGGDSVGDSDPMILPHYSYLLAGLIPQARVKIYPDSAHGFLFQHHAEFAGDVDEFLTGPA